MTLPRLVAAIVFVLVVGGSTYFVGRTSVPLMVKTGLLGSGNCFTQFKHSDSPLEVTALASYPRSGNTWTRHLLSAATGLYTVSVYNENSSSINDRTTTPSAFNWSYSLVVKTHEASDADRRIFSKAIVLLRNPMDSMLSEYCRRHYHGQRQCKGRLKPSAKLSEFLQLQANIWYLFYKSWFVQRRPLLVIFYEDLVVNPERELRKMLRFLRQSESNVQCAVSYIPTHRVTNVTNTGVLEEQSVAERVQLAELKRKIFKNATVLANG
ncbi:WSC domain-containing protein 2 [Lamellibrachia satsuma]|nr:WSC domain-containing protein 2 [Lamellibrachia satsuma]